MDMISTSKARFTFHKLVLSQRQQQVGAVCSGYRQQQRYITRIKPEMMQITPGKGRKPLGELVGN